jgi:hypothetical protein
MMAYILHMPSIGYTLYLQINALSSVDLLTCTEKNMYIAIPRKIEHMENNYSSEDSEHLLFYLL